MRFGWSTSFPVRRKLRILSVLFLSAFLALGVVAYGTIEAVKVNGPIYRNIVQGKDLIADVLPPPEYVIEAHLICLQLLQDGTTAEIAVQSSRLVALADEFERRHEYWSRSLPPGPLKACMVERSHDPGRRFYKALFAEFLPALAAGDRARAARVLSFGMKAAYAEHRRSIDEVVALAVERNRADERAAADLIAARARILILLVFASILMFGAIAALTIANVGREHDELERRVAERTADLQALAADLTRTEERERRAIAADLHDLIGQSLALAKMKLALAASDAAPDRTAALAEIRSLVEGAIAHTRSLLVELAPPVLHELGFDAALEWLAEEMRRKYGLAVDLTIAGELPALAEDARLLLFKGARELLVNAAKHAGVDRASLRVAAAGGSVEVRVEDEGVGFDPERGLVGPSRPGGGFGLFSLRERLACLGGRLDLETGPGRGARATLRLPLDGSF